MAISPTVVSGIHKVSKLFSVVK